MSRGKKPQRTSVGLSRWCSRNGNRALLPFVSFSAIVAMLWTPFGNAGATTSTVNPDNSQFRDALLSNLPLTSKASSSALQEEHSRRPNSSASGTTKLVIRARTPAVAPHTAKHTQAIPGAVGAQGLSDKFGNTDVGLSGPREPKGDRGPAGPQGPAGVS